MSLHNFLQILCLILFFSSGYVSAQRCGENMFFTRNGTYDTNRHLILSTLASNVTSRDGFYNVTLGQGPGKIYVLGLCIPGADPKVCSNCIQASSDSLLQNCLNQTDSRNWISDEKSLCLVRYSNTSFFSDNIDLEPWARDVIDLNVTGDLVEYTRIWEYFMARMISTASSSTPGTLAGRHYSANITSVSAFRRIYAVMQCIPGISSVDCYACLQANIATYQDCCRGKQGGAIKRPVCFFRFAPSPFFDAFDNIESPPLPQSPQDSQPTTSPPPPPSNGINISSGVIVAIVVSGVIFAALLSLGLIVLKRRKSYKTPKLETNDEIITSPHSLQFDFKTIEIATDIFSETNKLGQGGFGEVYKGMLRNGTEVAVKRLSKYSGQAHKSSRTRWFFWRSFNIGILLGFLVFAWKDTNNYLSTSLFPTRVLIIFSSIDWRRRHNIIGGIARGILYLHQDSRLTIIHRDLKASNILLDDEMNPKIADFGIARIFGIDQSQANTSKIAGTFFGVLVLEIINSKKNNSFYETDGSANNLVTHAWRLWEKGSGLELVDPTFGENYNRDEVTRCIHIALLCVQEDPEDRPMMSTIILMLTSSSITLQVPRSPGFFIQRPRDRDSEHESSNSSRKPVSYSITDVTITELEPR